MRIDEDPALVTHATLLVLWELRAKAQGLVYSPTRMADWKHLDGLDCPLQETAMKTPQLSLPSQTP